jgi:hypothetical protein
VVAHDNERPAGGDFLQVAVIDTYMHIKEINAAFKKIVFSDPLLKAGVHVIDGRQCKNFFKRLFNNPHETPRHWTGNVSLEIDKLVV